jgi:MFS family permease
MPPQHEETTAFARNSNVDNTSTSTRQSSASRRSFGFSTLQQIDPTEPVRRPSVFRRESFIVQFAQTKGPPQITLLMMLIAIGLGSTIGVVPAVMTDRFARLNHGYDGDQFCSDMDTSVRPAECIMGSADAQNVAAAASLASNVLTFLTSSLIGSLSDEHGRKGMFFAHLV